jgi:pyruvate formate lyase activating enzyme
MLDIGGFTPLSTTDWPDKLAAVVFVQGCPWRCHYCHNVALQPRQCEHPDGWARALDTLRQRQGLLDGVVFSGGEPTLDPALPQAMSAVRALGFQVGLHTAGIYPDRLQAVLPLVDWVGFDLKTTFEHYDRITAVPRSATPARQSLEAVLAAVRERQLGLEIRTTWHPQLHDASTLLALGQQLRERGITQWVLQAFRPTHPQHASLTAGWQPLPSALLDALRALGLQLALR